MRVVPILLLAIVYATAGWLGTRFAVSPGYATILFPASGIAVAVLLARGTQLWPGIWLGSALLNIGLSALAGELTGQMAALSAGIGLGASLQAVLGTWLARRTVPRPLDFEALPDIISLLAVTGPLACLVSALAGSALLLLAGIVPPHDFLVTMATWWGGDSLGVLIFTPLTLMGLLHRDSSWRKRRLTTGIPVAAGLAVVVSLYFETNAWERSDTNAQFRESADDVNRSLQENVRYTLLTMVSIRNFILTTGHIDAATFYGFTEALPSNLPSLRALGWVPRIEAGQRPAFEAMIRAESGQDFRIVERGGQNAMTEAGQRDAYFPVLYVTPQSLNRPAVGFDLATSPERFDALSRAAANNDLRASARVMLVAVGDAPPTAGVLVFAPIFWDSVPAHDSARRNAVSGFVLGVFQLDRFVEGAIGRKPHPELALRLLDVTVPDSPQELYVRSGESRGSGLSYRHDFDVAGRQWRLEASPTPDFIALHYHFQSLGVLAAGLSVLTILQVLLLEFSGQTIRINKVVQDRTRSLQLENQSRLAAEGLLEESRAKLQAVIDTVLDGIIMIDSAGIILHANPAAERIFGHALPQMMGNNVSMLMPEPDHSAHDGYLRSYLDGGPAKIINIGREVTGRRRDGSTFPMELGIAEVKVHGGRFFTGTIRDISARKQTETELRLAASVFHDTMEGVLIADGQKIIISVNPAFTAITGFSPEEVTGRPLTELKSDRHDDSFYRGIWASLHRDGRYQGEMWNRRKNGEAFLIWQSISMIRDEHDDPLRFVVVFRDVTEIRRDDERIRHIAFHDALTGLPNRLLLNDRLTHSLISAQRNQLPLGVMFLDLDGFKAVNDTLGHDVGDDLLREVARRLTTVVRLSDTVSRLGGDEFVVILENPDSLAEAIAVAERIIDAVNQPMTFKDRRVHVGVSVGIAMFPDDGTTEEDLMRRADEAMYRAKHEGKNVYRLAAPFRLSEALLTESAKR